MKITPVHSTASLISCHSHNRFPQNLAVSSSCFPSVFCFIKQPCLYANHSLCLPFPSNMVNLSFKIQQRFVSSVKLSQIPLRLQKQKLKTHTHLPPLCLHRASCITCSWCFISCLRSKAQCYSLHPVFKNKTEKFLEVSWVYQVSSSACIFVCTQQFPQTASPRNFLLELSDSAQGTPLTETFYLFTP